MLLKDPKLLGRRSFVHRTILATGGILFPVLPDRAVGQEGPPLRLYVNGYLVGVGRDQLQLSTDKGRVTLRLRSTSDIWKGRHGAPQSELQVGDEIAAVCEAGTGGELVVRELYANIVNYFGRIVFKGRHQFLLMPYQPEPVGHTYTIIVDGTASPTLINGGSGSFSDVQQGKYAQVVGLLTPKGIQATRIWLYDRRPADSRRR